MPAGGLPEETLKKVQYRGTPFQVEKYGYVGSLLHRKDMKHESHNTLGAELKILIQNLNRKQEQAEKH
ncbi:15914_t:CDS:2 [Cetraspora pellucida]|uniref:15914_t:CDS:1 n=1 Tax=Cetraspora pellucida TaxID=1433469 RepID=A0ACA9LUF5_9GLOM|nr:15914_t:CDS:2 [Cetraspora pellucida]